MTADPIVDEVREARRRIFEQCGDDLDRLIARFKELDTKDTLKLVTLKEVQERAGDLVGEPSSNQPLQNDLASRGR